MHEPTFQLHNLRVEIAPESKNLIGKHRVGDYFDVIGEDIFLPAGQGFSMYAISAILPLLPAKQRMTDAADWMTTDEAVADPDPHCGARYRITRTGITTFRRSDTTKTPYPHL